jgi:hypothetical protein
MTYENRKDLNYNGPSDVIIYNLRKEKTLFELGFLYICEQWLPEALKPLLESLFKGLLSSLRKIF